MSVEKEVWSIIEDSLAYNGYEVVSISYQGLKRKTLQIRIERKDRVEVAIEDCEKVSHLVSALLEVKDPIPDAYNLEVSSPGLDRPLVKLADYIRFAGKYGKFSLIAKINNMRHFKGQILDVEGEKIKIKLEDQDDPIIINYSDIASAKLKTSDDDYKDMLKK